MGLKERRAVKAYQENQFPGHKKRIDDAAGFEVDVEINYDSLIDPSSLHLIDECWHKVYFDSVVLAFEGITVDDMGKEALKEGLKKVVLQNTKDNSNASRCATFEGGVLTVDHKPTTNVDNVKDRAKAIQDLVEAAL